MKYLVTAAIIYSTIWSYAQTFSWSGFPNGGTSYTTGAMTATITSNAPGFQNGTPSHYAASTVGSGQCGISGGLALECMFGNITNAHATLTLNFTAGGTTSGLCSVISFQIRDINSDESIQTFADWVEISAIDGNNVAIPVANISATGGSSKTISTSGTTRIIRGYSGSYGSRSTSTCDNMTISVTPPTGGAVKSITVKYHPDYTACSSCYYNFTGPHRPAYQYISIGSITATPTGSCVALPVQLSAFKATRVGREVALNWTTEQEVNSDRFFVERSTDGEHYESVCSIPGAGNSSVPNYYTFTDKHAGLNQHYYRLKQVDRDGTETYFDLTSVEAYSGEELEWSVYPNPAKDFVTYELISPQEQLCTFTLLTCSGIILNQWTNQVPKGIYSENVLLNDLEAGTYLLQMTDELGNHSIQRILKINL